MNWKISLYFLLSLHLPHQEQIKTCKCFAVGLKDNSEILPSQYKKPKLSERESENAAF